MKSQIRMLFQRLLKVCLASLIVTLSATSNAADRPRIALVMKSLANPYFITMAEGARAHSREHSTQYELLVTGIQNETDSPEQIRILEQLIEDKVDAIVLAPADSGNLVPVVSKALEAGITVINIDNKLDDRVLIEAGINVPFVGASNTKGAIMVGSYLAKKLRTHDKVAIIEGISTTTNAKARTAGFRTSMASAGVEVVEIQSGQWESAIAERIATEMLQRHPDLKAILCGNDSMALGVAAAVRAAGREGTVKIIGYDNISPIAPMLADGRILATIDQFAGQQAVFGIEMALKALSEETPQKDLPAFVQTPLKLITRQ
ncbi:sugar ABC transporter substrate-binding protein [Pseudomonas peli]|uniref:sugar ABC transporter substrate-binding protein n=1 Tax=Pseudomonas peli TaxID=592361 RepID=UPI0024AE0E7D|nr:sugar ABC transporter substrate-binding protein [Pseudomonas peli]